MNTLGGAAERLGRDADDRKGEIRVAATCVIAAHVDAAEGIGAETAASAPTEPRAFRIIRSGGLGLLATPATRMSPKDPVGVEDVHEGRRETGVRVDAKPRLG